MKHALLSVIVALWCLKVSCRASPVRSAVNGLWFCCGIILGLFLAQGWPSLAFIETENCSSTLTSFSYIDNSTERWKRSHTRPFTHIDSSSFPHHSLQLLPAGERDHFLWPFISGLNTCFLLPVIASLHRKFTINVRKTYGLAHFVSDDEEVRV